MAKAPSVLLALVLAGLFVLAGLLLIEPEPSTWPAAVARYATVAAIAGLGVLALRLAHRSMAAPASERKEDDPPDYPRLAG